MSTGDPTVSLDAAADQPGEIATRTAAAEPEPARPDAAAVADLRRVAAGEYELAGEIAHGGMGQILEAIDRRHDRPVAIKRPLRADDASLQRFVREARLAARLQHPGIVPVYEAGVLPSGEPFFAMKHVQGKSLGEMVRAAGSFAARLALLPHLIAVADALAYAHSRGVVHRDLTPNNILVGDHGEVLVIDWGVAKEIGSPDGDATDSASAPDGLTATRGVVGTPRFMAPEQARGEPADPRADVYALGAVLYFALAGKPPYAEVASAQVDVVLAGPTAPLAAIASEVPPDLATIVTRAMAREPAERYPSAAELAADLKRFTTGELVRAHEYGMGALLRRWARRRRAALVAAAAALAVVAVVGALSVARIARERDVALAAQRRAESLSRSGEHLVGFLIDRLYKKLDAIGHLDALEGLGAEVATYYGDVASGQAADPSAVDRRIWALMTLGDVESQKGNNDQAEALYRPALALAEEQARDARAGGASAHRLGKLEMDLGDVEVAAGRPQAAEARFREAIRHAEAAARAEPDEPDHVQLLGSLQLRMGDVRMGEEDFAGAGTVYAGLLSSANRAHVRWPDDDNALHMVGWGHFRLAEIALRQGRYVDSAAELAAAREAQAELVRRQPDDLDYRRELAANEIGAGELAMDLRRLDDAAAHYQAVVDALRATAEADPANTELGYLLAYGYTGLCDAQLDRGLLEAAMASCRAVIALLEPHASGHVDYRYLLVDARSGLAEALADRRNLDEASALAHAAVDDATALVTDAPGDWRSQGELARASLAMSRVEDAAGRREAALVAARQAAAAIDTSLAGNDDAELLTSGVRAYLAIGDLERASGARARAAKAYRRAIVVAGASTSLRVRARLALACAGLAAAGDAGEAAAMLGKAHAIAAELRAGGALDPELAKRLRAGGVPL